MPLFDWDLEFMLDLAVARMVDLVSQSPKVTQVEERRLMQVFRRSPTNEGGLVVAVAAVAGQMFAIFSALALKKLPEVAFQ